MMICNKLYSSNIAEAEAKWGKGHWHDHDLPSWKDDLKSEWDHFKCQKTSFKNTANTEIEVQITQQHDENQKTSTKENFTFVQKNQSIIQRIFVITFFNKWQILSYQY